MVKSTESSVTPARSSRSAGDRIESEGIGSGSSSGGRSRRRRPVPDSPQHMAVRKRRHSEVDTADDQGGEQQPGNDAEAAADAGVATPAAKHARRSLYRTVSNLVGRAVGLFTPGRVHPPAEGSPSPTGGDSTPEVAVRDEAEQDQADGEKADQLDGTDLVDKPDDHDELPPGATVTTTSTFEPPGEEALNSHPREESLPRPAATTGGTSHGPGDTSLGLTDESTANNDGERETVTQPVVAPRSALRDPASSSPFISGALSGQDALIERMLPRGTFRIGIRRASEAGARMLSATIGSLASPVSRRVSREGQGLQFASIRRSTTGDDETDAPVPTPHFPRRGDLSAIKSALDDGVDLLSPSRRAQLARERAARERIYALATPAGAREWRRLTLTRQRALLATMHGRSGLPSNELGTPAAQPEPSAARSADDEDLPVITLSVPYPFGAPPTDLITSSVFTPASAPAPAPGPAVVPSSFPSSSVATPASAPAPAPGPAVVPSSPFPRERGTGTGRGPTSDVEVHNNSNMGADGGVLSAIPVTPTKFWTCSGCNCRNFDFSAKACNMCRYAKDPAARYRSPNVVFPDFQGAFRIWDRRNVIPRLAATNPAPAPAPAPPPAPAPALVTTAISSPSPRSIHQGISAFPPLDLPRLGAARLSPPPWGRSSGNLKQSPHETGDAVAVYVTGAPMTGNPQAPGSGASAAPTASTEQFVEDMDVDNTPVFTNHGLTLAHAPAPVMPIRTHTFQFGVSDPARKTRRAGRRVRK